MHQFVWILIVLLHGQNGNMKVAPVAVFAQQEDCVAVLQRLQAGALKKGEAGACFERELVGTAT